MSVTVATKNSGAAGTFQVNGVDSVVFDSTGIIQGGNSTVMYENDALITAPYVVGQNAQQTCSISIASPAVVSMTNNFVANQPVRFVSTGTLPTGIAINTPYYVMATGLTTGQFQISATVGGTAISTSGTQSGTVTCGKVKNAIMSGPMYLLSGASVTVPTGSRLVVA